MNDPNRRENPHVDRDDTPERSGRATERVGVSLTTSEQASAEQASLTAPPLAEARPRGADSAARLIVRRYAWPSTTDTVDLASHATVEVDSEQELFPIDHLFDGQNGAGGSCWVAGRSGAQAIVLRLHTPMRASRLTIESEERVTASQRIDVSIWGEGSDEPYVAQARELQYSPYGNSFHRETWNLADLGGTNVTRLRVRVTPSPESRFATLTAISLR